MSWEWERQVAKGGAWSVGLVLGAELKAEAEDIGREGSRVKERFASSGGGEEEDGWEFEASGGALGVDIAGVGVLVSGGWDEVHGMQCSDGH